MRLEKSLGWIVGAVALAIVLLIGRHAEAEVHLPAIFSSHMVIQRDRPIAVWGWADAGEAVVVEFGGRHAEAKADADGRWRVRLDALPVSREGRTLTIAGANKVAFSDVLVGDVWLASGQSNMAMSARKSLEWKETEPSAADDQLRVFRVNPLKASPMEALDDCRGEWAAADAQTAGNVTAAGYYFARSLRAELGVPIGLIDSAWGGTCAEYWTSHEALEANPVTRPLWATFKAKVDAFDPATATPKEEAQRLMEEFRKKNEAARAAKARLPKPPAIIGSPANKRYAPCNMYNTMIHPLIPYTLRGVVWYQGESNRERAEQYETLLAVIIADWRTRWDAADLPFGIVQLANLKDPGDEPHESEWAEEQWAQLRVSQTVPHTGLAVINDGQDTTLHPREKKKVGDRLALWALATVYGKTGVAYTAPVYRDAAVEGGAVRVRFDHAGGLRSADGKPLRRFQIAGKDRVWVWAEAKIDGETVVVSSDKVAEPVAVRYAWEANPGSANLTNASGLPASLFRTDDWPGLSHGKLAPDGDTR
ncbi:MAG: sialate O-acetylesterase [Phycisphaera sp.]|nr:sialate O-acetylesterase [Phycisphaera sp.]